jgi:hypothetical protein|tara:strand:- start:89 stop:757 length:669 start_codon:yes stop_codon:yes gene_type:complete
MSNDKYNNYLTKYKGELWGKCIKSNIFNNISEDHINDVKKTFEENIENYKTQIMQNDDDNNLDNIIINNINNQIGHLKNDTINKNYDNKKKEYEDLANNSSPEQLDFKDSNVDKPIENFENLIEQQMNERKKLITQFNNDTSNKDISNNYTDDNNERNEIIGEINNSNDTFLDNKMYEVNNNIDLSEIVNNQKMIINTLNIHTDILNKLLKSQIYILENIKS